MGIIRLNNTIMPELFKESIGGIGPIGLKAAIVEIVKKGM